MLASLSCEKVERIMSILSIFVNKKKCTQHKPQSLLGHVYVTLLVVWLYPICAFISHLIELLNSVKNPNIVSAECRIDLALLRKSLVHWNGVSVFIWLIY